MRRSTIFLLCVVILAIFTRSRFELSPVQAQLERMSNVDSATATTITAGSAHTCAVSGGGVKCWGWNGWGQLGNGTVDDSLVPVDVANLGNGVRAVSAGGLHTCALLNSGAVKCWGSNNYGQLGNGTVADHSRTPVDVIGLNSGVVAIDVGTAHTCALLSSGSMKCWGSNEHGELGDGTRNNRSTPIDVVGLSGTINLVSAGGGYTCAVINSAAKCWGWNNSGQLGDGTVDDRLAPVDVSGLTNGVVAISAEDTARADTPEAHTCAILNNGGAKCWGGNSAGQLGDGTVNAHRTPVDVAGLSSGVVSISAGSTSGNHPYTCALISNGSIKCWGGNDVGQLGDGTVNAHYTPTDVRDLNGTASAVTTGAGQTCTLLNTGGVRCWGWNIYGQLGDQTRENRYTPVTVVGLGGGIPPTVTPTPTHTPTPAFPVDLGFRPTPNGYGFNNQQLFPSIDKTWAMFEQFFGRENVRKPDGTKCTEAVTYAQKNYREVANGWSCFGYSMSSLISYLNLPQPNAGAFAIPHFDRLYDQPQSAQLTDPIAYYARTQLTKGIGSDYGVQVDTCRSNSNGPIQRIKQSIQNRQPTVIYLNSKKNYAHAVVPYRVEETSSSEAYVYVYDSESRGTEQRIHFQRLENDWRWKYTFLGSLGFIGTPQDTGCAEIYLYPLDIALNRGEPPINFCEQPTGKSVETTPNEIYRTERMLATLPTEGDWVIRDSNGRRLGWIDGQFVAEIPDGYEIAQAFGTEPLSYRALYLPETEYFVEVRNSPTQTIDALVYGDGRLLEVTGQLQSLNSTVGVHLNSSLEQTTMYGMQNLDWFILSFDHELPTTSRLAIIPGKSNSGNNDLNVNFNGEQVVISRTNGLLQYSLVFGQVGVQESAFASGQIILGPNEKHTLQPSTWENLNSSSVTLEIDRGIDGTVDETRILESQISHIYLPLILNAIP